MSEEQTETTEQSPEVSDKEINFQKLREQKEALEAELASLRPLQTKETLRQAGFDPDTPEGKALSVAIKAGEVEANPDQIVAYAGSEFGWEPKPRLTETEATQVEGSKRLEAVRQVTQSDGPQDTKALIAEAEQSGDWMTAMQLKVRDLAEQNH